MLLAPRKREINEKGVTGGHRPLDRHYLIHRRIYRTYKLVYDLDSWQQVNYLTVLVGTVLYPYQVPVTWYPYGAYLGTRYGVYLYSVR